MATKRVLIAFAKEDERMRDLLKGQALNTRSPFEYVEAAAARRRPLDRPSWPTLDGVNHDEPLRAFDQAVTNFRETSYDMHGPVGRLSGSDHTLRAQAGQTAYDVFACCHTFRAVYGRMHDKIREGLRRFQSEFADWPQGEHIPEEAYEVFWESFRERQYAHLNSPEHRAELEQAREEIDARIEGRDANAEFTVAFKSLFLFMRAHQDSLCALVLLVQRPRATATGEYSMTRHLKQDGRLVQMFIRTEVPGYEDWYWRWREARNKIKRGVNFGMSGNWQELGISFATFIPEGGGVMVDHSAVVRLTDLIEALDMSTQLHRAIARKATETAQAASTA